MPQKQPPARTARSVLIVYPPPDIVLSLSSTQWIANFNTRRGEHQAPGELICTSIISPLTIHGQPNLSVTMPKPLAQNVGPKGMVTLPPSAASALNTRSAGATAS